MSKAKIDSVTVSTAHFCAMCDNGDLLIRFNVPEETTGLCLEMGEKSISALIDELYAIKARLSFMGIGGWKEGNDVASLEEVPCMWIPMEGGPGKVSEV